MHGGSDTFSTRRAVELIDALGIYRLTTYNTKKSFWTNYIQNLVSSRILNWALPGFTALVLHSSALVGSEAQEEDDVFEEDERRRQHRFDVILHHQEVHAELPDLDRVCVHLLEHIPASTKRHTDHHMLTSATSDVTDAREDGDEEVEEQDVSDEQVEAGEHRDERVELGTGCAVKLNARASFLTLLRSACNQTISSYNSHLCMTSHMHAPSSSSRNSSP